MSRNLSLFIKVKIGTTCLESLTDTLSPHIWIRLFFIVLFPVVFGSYVSFDVFHISPYFKGLPCWVLLVCYSPLRLDLYLRSFKYQLPLILCYHVQMAVHHHQSIVYKTYSHCCLHPCNIFITERKTIGFRDKAHQKMLLWPLKHLRHLSE